MKPLHPILVQFPIALIPVSVAADAIGLLGHIVSLSPTAVQMLLSRDRQRYCVEAGRRRSPSGGRISAR